MSTRLIAALAALLAGAACSGGTDEAPPEEMISPFRVLPNITIPPGGEVVGSEGGQEAASLLVSTPMVADSVIEFYRGVLGRPPYRLVNEAVDGKRTTFYVEQEGPSLWVTVEGLDAGGTLVRLSGAAVKTDSSAAGQRTATDSSP